MKFFSVISLSFLDGTGLLLMFYVCLKKLIIKEKTKYW